MKLEKPVNQITEVLNILLKNKEGVTRLQFMMYAGVLNAPGQIHKLRRLGVDIETITITTTNKFKREVEFCKYKVINTRKSKKIYNQLISAHND